MPLLLRMTTTEYQVEPIAVRFRITQTIIEDIDETMISPEQQQKKMSKPRHLPF